MKLFCAIIFSVVSFCSISNAAMQQKVYKDTYSCAFVRGTSAEAKSSPAIIYFESGIVNIEIGDSNTAMALIPVKRKELIDALSKYKAMAEKVEKANVSQKISVATLRNNYFYILEKKASTDGGKAQKEKDADKISKNVAKLVKYDIQFVTRGEKGKYSYCLELSFPKVPTDAKEKDTNVMEKVTIWLDKGQVAALLEKLSDEKVKNISTNLRSGELKPSPLEKKLVYDL